MRIKRGFVPTSLVSKHGVPCLPKLHFFFIKESTFHHYFRYRRQVCICHEAIIIFQSHFCSFPNFKIHHILDEAIQFSFLGEEAIQFSFLGE